MEMAGIEPASERIDRRTSTSVVDCLGCRRQHYKRPKVTAWLSAEARKPLLGTFSDILCRTLALRRPYSLQPELGVRGRDPFGVNSVNHCTMQRAEEQNSLCFWHLCCVLILRVRYLSARSSRPASPSKPIIPDG